MYSIDIPAPNSVESISDWLELTATINNESISKAYASSQIEKSSGDEPSDAFLADIWIELGSRTYLYGNNPPFTIEGSEIIPRISWEEHPEYLTCLILSLKGNPREKTKTGKLFERISNEALRNYLDGESFVFGFPNQHKTEKIARELNETFRSEMPPQYKDRGVDVIGWKPFSDNRGSQVIVLMQCAGGNNWKQKTKDVPLRAWESYIGFQCEPLKGFSTAVIISDKTEFAESSHEAGLLFDRTRLYKYTVDFELTQGLREELRDWCEKRIDEYFR